MKLEKNRAEINLQDLETLLSTKGDGELVSLRYMVTDDVSWTDGIFDVLKYKNCAYVGIKDLSISETFNTDSILENMVSFEFMLQGGSDMQLGNKSIFNNNMPRLYVTSHYKESHQARFHRAGETYRGVGLWISPQHLNELFNLKLDEFPQSVSKILTAAENRTVTYPLTGTIRQTVEQILTNEFKGNYCVQYLEAKITELFCHSLACMTSPELAYSNDNHLSASKTNAMKKLLEKLEENIDTELYLDTLGSELGMSKGQLVRTFKTSYGMNISEYLTQKRMERSQMLIKEGKLSILQVAFEVGYKNQSSFGRAFKKYFGYSPAKDRSL